jgi:hypothetical protein
MSSENAMSDDPAKNTSEREAKIRSRAYDLWEAAGCPEGREQEFWKQAEALIDEEGGGDKEGSA